MCLRNQNQCLLSLHIFHVVFFFFFRPDADAEDDDAEYSIYNMSAAGQTTFGEDVERDEFGVAKGNQFDLATPGSRCDSLLSYCIGTYPPQSTDWAHHPPQWRYFTSWGAANKVRLVNFMLN